jgi:hypothetical protein
MKGIYWIDKAREKLGGVSYYQMAKELGTTKAAISAHKNETCTTLDEDKCLKLAGILEIDPVIILLDQAEEKCKNVEAKKVWHTLRGKMGALEDSILCSIRHFLCYSILITRSHYYLAVI